MKPSWPRPESRSQTLPSWSRGECGIDRPSATTALVVTSMSMPPSARRSRHPSATFEAVVEAKELEMGGEEQRSAVLGDAEPHAARKGPLEDGEASVGLGAEQEQLACLVCGDRQADPRTREPLGEIARAGERELLFLDKRLVVQGSVPSAR